MKRLFLVFVLVLAASVTVVSDAPAGDIADQPCPDASGPNTGVCPAGRVGVPYSIRFLLKEGSGCGPGKESWSITSGNFPPGLTLASEGVVSGTPTQAGSFTFFVTVTHPVEPGCNGGFSDRQVTVSMLPEIPKLVIQEPGVPIATVGAPFSLQLATNLADPKTWSVAEGALPTGLALDSTSGVITGSPTVDGSFAVRVQAALADGRKDDKWVTITVRKQLVIAAPKVPSSEVGVPFELVLTATGGTETLETFTWEIASGALPDGVDFFGGTISGTPESAGTFRFTVTVTDAEGRVTTYAGRVIVARELAISTQKLRSGKVGRLYRASLKASGGVLPKKWKLTKGQLPRGVRFDRKLGVLAGIPKKAGRYRVTAELTDGLKVKVTKTFTILVLASPAKRG